MARITLICWLLALTASPLFAQDRVQLRVASWANEKEFELEQRILALFEERHPGVEIAFESMPSGYRDKILAAGGTKDAADLVADFLGRAYDFKAFEHYLLK